MNFHKLLSVFLLFSLRAFAQNDGDPHPTEVGYVYDAGLSRYVRDVSLEASPPATQAYVDSQLIPKADVTALTAETARAQAAEALLQPLDEDDFGSDSATRAPSQQSAHRYIDRRDAYLEGLGNVRQGMTMRFILGTGRTVSMDAGTFLDWDSVTHQSDPHVIAAESPMSFGYIMSDGATPALDTGVVPDASNTTIITNLQYEQGGAVTNVTSNREIAHRLYINPLTGDKKLLLAQHEWNTAAELLQKIQTEVVIVPAALASYEYVGAILVSQNSTNYEAGNNSGILMASEFGSVTGSGGSGSAEALPFILTANVGERDALTNELVSGITVGVLDDGDGNYAEYRIITPATDFATSTKEKVWPLAIATDLEAATGTIEDKPVNPLQLKTGLDTKVTRGTTNEKNTLGVVPSNTPFFDTDLGVLQYYKTSTDNFIVVKAATDLPYLVEWASANSVFSAMRFKITTSLTDTVDNSVVNLPDGEDVLLYMIGRQFFNGAVAANTLGGAFTVRNDGGTLTLVSVEPTRHWSGGLDWTTASYQELTTEVTAPIGITIDDVNSILANVAGAGVWTSLEGGGTPAFSEIVEPFATDGASFPPEPADAAVDKAYLTVLTADDIGTGTVENPQFRSGQYLSLGSGWNYYGSSTAIRPELTMAQLQSITDTTVGAVSGQSLFNRDFTRQGQSTDFTATNGQQLIPKVWSAERLNEQFAAPDQRVIAGGYLEDFGIFRELDITVAGATTGTITFPEGGFSSPPKVQATAEVNGHTVNIRNVTTTQFTYDQWDVEDIQQGGGFTYCAKGLKP